MTPLIAMIQLCAGSKGPAPMGPRTYEVPLLARGGGGGGCVCSQNVKENDENLSFLDWVSHGYS